VTDPIPFYTVGKDPSGFYVLAIGAPFKMGLPAYYVSHSMVWSGEGRRYLYNFTTHAEAQAYADWLEEARRNGHPLEWEQTDRVELNKIETADSAIWSPVRRLAQIAILASAAHAQLREAPRPSDLLPTLAQMLDVIYYLTFMPSSFLEANKANLTFKTGGGGTSAQDKPDQSALPGRT